MKINRAITAIVGVLILTFCTLATADEAEFGPNSSFDQFGQNQPPQRSHHGPPPPPKFWADIEWIGQLGPTDQQIDALEKLEQIYEEQRIDLKAQLEKAQLRLEQAFGKDDPDETAIRQAARNLSALHGKLFELSIEHRLDVNKVLTTEQMNLLKTKMPHGGPPMGPGMRGPKQLRELRID